MELISPIHIKWVTVVICLLFLFVIKNEIGRYLLMGLYGIIAFLLGVYFDRGQEYEIKLIDQTHVEIKSFVTGRAYIVAPEKITETIDKDNL